MHESLVIRMPWASRLLLMACLLASSSTCQAQADRLPQSARRSVQPPRRPTKSTDPFQSLLDFVRQEQEIEFAKPLPEFSATVKGAQSIEKQVRAAYPSKKELAVYSLDWEPTLAAARKRAQVEQRPIFFIVVTNYSGPTNFFSGHC